MLDDDESHEEVNKTAEGKRGSAFNPASGEDEDAMRRNDGISESNLPKSNCKWRNAAILFIIILLFLSFRQLGGSGDGTWPACR